MRSIINPATQKPVAEILDDDEASVCSKYLRARNAQSTWAQTPLVQRIHALKKWNELLLENTDKLASDLTAETGKPISQSRSEIKSTKSRVDFFTQHLENFLQPIKVYEKPGVMEEEYSWEPLGVIANISAWNYPYFVGANVFIPALLMGNAVLYKPSEFASLTGGHIVSLMHEAGVPEDVMIVVQGSGEVGSILIDQPVDGIFFTGSHQTGVKILKQAREKMIPVQLELGGKDPTYVCEDVDIAKAAKSLAEGVFYNTGQGCCSVERIYVHEAIYDAFLEHLIAETKAFVVGDPTDEKTFIGPLTREAQLEVLHKQVSDAKNLGGRILLGGEKQKGAGYYFAPTIITDANHQMTCMREESFGPIVGVQKVGNDSEALSLMNDTSYGLTAGIYCQSEKRAKAFLSQVNAGTVYWNCCDRVSPRLPWTGRKNSGIGSTLSIEGLRTFGRAKAWHLKT